MAKDKKQYVCSACGTVQLRWSGKCPECGEWNTLEEEIVRAPEKVKGAMPVAARAASIHQRPFNARGGDDGGVFAHGAGKAGEFGGGLAFYAQGREQGGDLRHRGLAGEDQIERVLGLIGRERHAAGRLVQVVEKGHVLLKFRLSPHPSTAGKNRSHTPHRS